MTKKKAASPKKARPHSITFPNPSLTEQSHKQACDINNIVRTYQKTGLIEHQAKHAASYHDHDSRSFHDAMNTIARTNSMFEELPATERQRFKNDPALWLDHVHSSLSIEEQSDVMSEANVSEAEKKEQSDAKNEGEIDNSSP